MPAYTENQFAKDAIVKCDIAEVFDGGVDFSLPPSGRMATISVGAPFAFR